LFNRGFNRATAAYESSVKRLVARKLVGFAALALCGLACFGLLRVLPTGFVPPEDQGYFMMTVQLPNAASLERTADVLKQIEDVLLTTPGVEYVIAIAGNNILSGSSASNMATVFVILKPWDERKTPQLAVTGIIGASQRKLAALPQAMIMAFNPPAVPGLGRTGGFQFELEDRGSHDLIELVGASQQALSAAAQQPEIAA